MHESRRGNNWILIKMHDLHHGSLSALLTNKSVSHQLVLCSKKMSGEDDCLLNGCTAKFHLHNASV